MSSEIKNIAESKCSVKIETNSKGHNTTVHIYQGCSETEWKKTADDAVAFHNYLQQKLGGNKAE